MFEGLEQLPADAILGLMAEFKSDSRPQKIDLGVGVYRAADGNTPILDVVKEAERRLIETQSTKAYLGTAGQASFNTAMQQLIFGDAVSDERLTTVQTPGGSGSLRVAASLLKKLQPVSPVWVSEPTWNNHVPLLGGAAGDLFGVRVALSGDTVLIGSRFDDDNGDDSGSAYVFTRSGITWSQQAKLTASDGAADDAIGRSETLG